MFICTQGKMNAYYHVCTQGTMNAYYYVYLCPWYDECLLPCLSVPRVKWMSTTVFVPRVQGMPTTMFICTQGTMNAYYHVYLYPGYNECLLPCLSIPRVKWMPTTVHPTWSFMDSLCPWILTTPTSSSSMMVFAIDMGVWLTSVLVLRENSALQKEVSPSKIISLDIYFENRYLLSCSLCGFYLTIGSYCRCRN